MELEKYKKAKELLDKAELIEKQLVLLNNDYDNYIVSFYDKNAENENDGNIINSENENQKVNLFDIKGEFKKNISDYLFKEKQRLLDEFSNL